MDKVVIKIDQSEDDVDIVDEIKVILKRRGYSVDDSVISVDYLSNAIVYTFYRTT